MKANEYIHLAERTRKYESKNKDDNNQTPPSSGERNAVASSFEPTENHGTLILNANCAP